MSKITDISDHERRKAVSLGSRQGYRNVRHTYKFLPFYDDVEFSSLRNYQMI